MLMVASGAKRIGKTFQSLTDIYKYVGGNQAKGIPGRRVLILDYNGEYGQFKRMDWRHIPVFSAHPKIEIRRIDRYTSDGKVLTPDQYAGVLSYALDNFRDGLLVIEDMTAYISDSLPNDLIGAIFTMRHKGVDVIIHFQMIGKAGHPKIIGGINILRLHYCQDSVERHESKFEDRYGVLKIAEYIIKTDYQRALTEPEYRTSGRMMGVFDKKNDYKSGFVYVNFDNNLISGKFNREMFDEALTNYIYYNERYELKPYLMMKDKTGKAVYSHEQAFTKCHDTLFNYHYGNK